MTGRQLSGSQQVRLAAVGCGVLAVGVAAAEAGPGLGWVALPGVAGAVAAGWRRTRWLAALTGFSALALSLDGRTTSTALLVGALLVGFVLLADLADATDLPDLAVALPTEDGSSAPIGAVGELVGWVRTGGLLWLAGALGALAVALVERSSIAPVAGIVALAPVVALVAAVLALGRGRGEADR